MVYISKFGGKVLIYEEYERTNIIYTFQYQNIESKLIHLKHLYLK